MAVMAVIVLGGATLAMTTLLLLRAPAPVERIDPPMYTYNGTHGPYLGTVDATGKWIAGPLVNSFKPGDTVVWEAANEVLPGVSVDAEFILLCRGQPLLAEDNHTSASVRGTGWMPYHIVLPRGTPDGQCEIRRHLKLTSADGTRVQERTFPTVYINVQGDRLDR